MDRFEGCIYMRSKFASEREQAQACSFRSDSVADYEVLVGNAGHVFFVDEEHQSFGSYSWETLWLNPCARGCEECPIYSQIETQRAQEVATFKDYWSGKSFWELWFLESEFYGYIMTRNNPFPPILPTDKLNYKGPKISTASVDEIYAWLKQEVKQCAVALGYKAFC